MAKAVTPWRRQSLAIAAFSVWGASKAASTAPFLSRPLSAALGPRTLSTISASASAVRASGAMLAPAAT